MAYEMSVGSLLAITSILEFSRISIDFVLAYIQADLDVDVFIDLPLGVGVDVNRDEWFLKLNKSLYGLNQANTN